MEAVVKATVLFQGQPVAVSTLSFVDIDIPGSHTFDLVNIDEDPDTTESDYQLVLDLVPGKPSPVKPATTVRRSDVRLMGESKR